MTANLTSALTLAEAANVLRCSTDYIRRAILRGDLLALRVGPRYRIFPEHLGEFIKSQRYIPRVSRRVKCNSGYAASNIRAACIQARKEVLHGR